MGRRRNNPFAAADQRAGAAYGVNPKLLEAIGFRESGNRAVAVNNYDSNARAGHRSEGRDQFIQPTFDAYSRQARAERPDAWRGVSTDWRDPVAQTLTTAWAIKHGHGKAWSTYGAALQDVGGQVGAPKGGFTSIAPAPAAPTAPASTTGGPLATTMAGFFPDNPLLQYAILNHASPHAALVSEGTPTPIPGTPAAAPSGSGVVDAARAQVGSTLAQAAAFVKKQGESFDSAWCGDFVRAVFRERGLKPPPARYVPDLLKWAQQNHRFTTKPQAGALAMFDWNHDGVPDHVGIATGANRGGLRGSIEGNTSTPTGRGVAEKYRNPRDIIGYALA